MNSDAGHRSDWQRRYDASLAAEREKDRPSATHVGEAAMEASSCLPGALGVVAMAAAATVMLVRRRNRRRLLQRLLGLAPE